MSTSPPPIAPSQRRVRGLFLSIVLNAVIPVLLYTFAKRYLAASAFTAPWPGWRRAGGLCYLPSAGPRTWPGTWPFPDQYRAMSLTGGPRSARSLISSLPPERSSSRGGLPNLRLKLSGLFLKESAVASPGALPRGGPVTCARGHVARSLSAIR